MAGGNMSDAIDAAQRAGCKTESVVKLEQLHQARNIVVADSHPPPRRDISRQPSLDTHSARERSRSYQPNKPNRAGTDRAVEKRPVEGTGSCLLRQPILGLTMFSSVLLE